MFDRSRTQRARRDTRRRPRRTEWSRGSVTLVLTMVLVPVVALAGMFVDGSRGVLSRSVVRSAEQLVINDILAQHDDDLRKTFGLLAVLESEGLGKNASQLLRQAVSSGEGGDLLRIDLAGDAGEVSVVANANLGQSEVLANQIVEYMKYRAPADFISQIADSINWLRNLETKLDVIKKRIEGINKLAKLIDAVNKLFKTVEKLIPAMAEAQAALESVEVLTTPGPDSLDSRFKDLLEARIADDLEPTDDTARAVKDAQAKVDEATTLLSDAQKKVGVVMTLSLDLNPVEIQSAANDLLEYVDTQLKPAIKKDKDSGGAEANDVADAEADAGMIESIAKAVLKDIVDELPEADRKELTEAAERFVKDSKKILTEKYTPFKINALILDGIKAARDGMKDAIAKDDFNLDDAALSALLKFGWDKIFTTFKDDIRGPFKELTTAVLMSVTKNWANTKLVKIRDSIARYVGDKAVDAATDTAKASFKAMLDNLKNQALEHVEFTKGLFEKKATYLKAGDGAWDERPSVTGDVVEIEDSVASFADIDTDATNEVNNKATGLLDQVLSLLGKLSGFVEEVRDGVYFAEYVTGMFTYSSLKNVSVTAKESDAQNCMFSKACTKQKAEADAKAKEKADANGDRPKDTDAVSSGDPGARISQEKFAECWEKTCATEVEYILTGLNSAAGTYGFISLIRMAVNTIVAFRDKLVTSIRTVVAAIWPIAWMAPGVPFIAALMQTYSDLSKLDGGHLVPFMHDNIEVLRFDGVLTKETLKIGSINEDYLTQQERTYSSRTQKMLGVQLGYVHYLKVFLIFWWGGRSNEMLGRTADVVQFNMTYMKRPDVRLSNAGTAFTVTTEYQVKPFVSTFFGGVDSGAGLFSGDKGTFRLTSAGGF